MITDLTKGKPSSVLFKFTVPLILSVAFQQIYNMADSMIAGIFAGESALAAVGASYPITMLFMSVAIGSNIGCSVVISQLFGAQQKGQLKTAIGTSFISNFVLAAVLTVLGIIFTPHIMRLIDTPADIIGDGGLYLQIYLAGLIFVFIYNIATGIFTALGDSKTPLIFLIISSVANIGLDLLFVAVFNWGVAGVAWATFIAQGAACLLSVGVLIKKLKQIKTEEKPKKFTFKMLKTISRIAVPSIFQQCFVSVGNVFIQSLINSFGSAVIAGYSAAIKLNTFGITAFAALGNGVSAFTAQNVGAEKPRRVKRGWISALIFGGAISVILFFVYFIFREQMIGLFLSNPSAEALKSGADFLMLVSPFYIFVSVKLISDGVLRGFGAMKMFVISTFSDLAIRVILSYILVNFWGITGIYLSWGIGWFVAMAVAGLFGIALIKDKVNEKD